MNTEKRLIVVLGMHRSGTSLLTKGLEVLGVNLGNEFYPTTPDNPKGYWEHRGIHALNEELLAALNRAWDGLEYPAPDSVSRLCDGDFFHRAKALVLHCLSWEGIIGIKDPRAALLLPFWKKVFGETGVPVSYVIAVRNPLSVADSLAQRDGFPKAKTLWLWALHNAGIVSDIAGESRVVVDYDRLVDDPGGQFSRVARALGLPVDQNAMFKYTTEYLETALRHTRYSLEDVRNDPDCSGVISTIHEALHLEAETDVPNDAFRWETLAAGWQEQITRCKSLLNLSAELESANRVLKTDVALLQQKTTLPATAAVWSDIPGWFQWRAGQEEAVRHFPDGSRFVEVGNYLGRSLCSLAEIAQSLGKSPVIIGVDTCRGSGAEGARGKDYHGAAVSEGGGTFAGTLHRNVIGCGYKDAVSLIVADSIVASSFFPDHSLDWVHLDARHEYEAVKADIRAWLPKVKAGGWLTGDDYDEAKWEGVVRAVREELPGAQPWCNQQWRWAVRSPRRFFRWRP